METVELVAAAGLILSLLLMFKVFRLQARLNDLQSDLEWLKNRPGTAAVSAPGSATEAGRTGAAAPQPIPAEGELDEKVRFLLAQQNKIKAVKEVRIATGMSLVEAKEYVDEVERRFG